MTDRTCCLLATDADPSAGVTARLAVVLGGGGKRGAFEVGVVNVLSSRGVVPELLVGTSVGAINAAFWAFHPKATAGLRLLELWKEAERFVQMSLGWLTGFRQMMSRQNHLVRPDGLVRLLQDAFGSSTRIEDARISLVITAVDLKTV